MSRVPVGGSAMAKQSARSDPANREAIELSAGNGAARAWRKSSRMGRPSDAASRLLAGVEENGSGEGIRTLDPLVGAHGPTRRWNRYRRRARPDQCPVT